MGVAQHQIQNWFIRTITALTLALIGSQAGSKQLKGRHSSGHKNAGALGSKGKLHKKSSHGPNTGGVPSGTGEKLLAVNNIELPGNSYDTASAKTNARSIKPPLDIAETDEGEEGDPSTRRKSESPTHLHESHWERLVGGGGGGRFIHKNLWDVCCNEIESEVKELDTILQKLGLPSVNYSKTKAYDITDYDYPPDMQQCKSKDFLDFYVFPYLLPAIQALIQFARVNRVFQCRFCTFNALDYIVEYLYNNNPRYPERYENPVPIFEIPFAKAWLEKHPRKPPPKWMLMSSEEAAIIIQRAVRGYMVRSRPEVQEMRQFWRDFKKDLEEQNNNVFQYGKILPAILQQKAASAAGPIFSPYYEEYRGEFGEESCESPCIRSQYTLDERQSSASISHHSDQCAFCQAFRRFLDTQPEEVLLSYKRPSTVENIEEVKVDSAKPSELGNEEIAGSGEEEEEEANKTGRKESTSGQTGQQHLSLNTQELTPQQRQISATSSKVKAQTHHKIPAMSVQKSATAIRQSKEKKKK